MEVNRKMLPFKETFPILGNEKLFENSIISVKEASILLGVSSKTIYKLVKEKAIPFKKVGGKIRFFLPQLVDWLKKGG